MTSWNVNRRALLMGGASLAAGACSSTAIAPQNFTPRYPRTQTLIDAFVAEGRLPNSVVLVKVPHAEATVLKAGAVEFGATQAVDEDTIFRAYSMTKPVTGFAAALLIEDGRLSLDQPIAEHVSEFRDMRVMTGASLGDTRPAAAPITVRHLLTHTAGFSYFILGDSALPRAYRNEGLYAGGRALPLLPGENGGAPPATLDEFGARLARLPLAFDPGAYWQYSVSLDVLGLVIQRASGIPFDEFLRRRIFAPLRMLDTAFYVPADKLSRFTTNYLKGEDGLVDVDNRANSPFAQVEGVPYGGAGLVSTARDYARFCHMLLNGGALDGVRIARRETVELVTSDLLPEGFDSAASQLGGAAFGAGMAITTPASARPNEKLPGSYSWGGAAGTLFWVDPAMQSFVVFMTQVMNENDAIWLPLQLAIYADIAAMPQVRPRPIDMTSRPRRNY